jgi:PEP-CTERM motif
MTFGHDYGHQLVFVSVSIISCVLCFGTATTQAAPVGYQFDGLAFYQDGNPGDLSPLALYNASPDTGFFRISNNGASKFTGTIGQVAVGSGGTDRSFTVPVTLNPGDGITLSTSEESSNFGGWNGPGGDLGNPQPGIKIVMSGIVSLGPNSEPVDLSIFDKDIHSPVVQTNPFGVDLDNYILQGGDPFGRDTGDAFEETRNRDNGSPGPFQFLEAVPEPASVLLMAIGAAVLALGQRSFA